MHEHIGQVITMLYQVKTYFFWAISFIILSKILPTFPYDYCVLSTPLYSLVLVNCLIQVSTSGKCTAWAFNDNPFKPLTFEKKRHFTL